MTKSALALAMLLTAVWAGQAQAWETKASGNFCITEQTFDDGTFVEFSLHKSGSWGTLSFWNDRWDSVIEDQRYTLRVRFDRFAEHSLDANGMRSESSGGVLASYDDLDFLAEAMTANSLFAWNGDAFIGRYSMAGTSRSFEKLGECAGRLSVHAAEDPFGK